MKNFFLKAIIFILIFPAVGLFAALYDDEDADKNREKFYTIIKYYEGEIKKTPDNLKLILAVAEVYNSLKEYDKAIEYYKKALLLDPENIQIKTDLALAYLNKNDLASSQKLLNELIQIEPQNLDVLGGLGRIEALKHHLSRAEDYYQKVLAKDPSHFSTLFYLAELKTEEKQYSEAQDILKELLHRDPKANWVKQALKRAELGPILQKIDTLERGGDYQSAIVLMEDELAKDPNNLDLYLAFNQLYTKIGQYENAIQIVKEAIKRFPDENSLRIALGFTYLAKKDLIRSQLIFEDILQTSPDQTEVLAGLGRIASLRDEPDLAEKFYRQALQVDPFNILALSYLAQLRKDQKKYKEAQVLYEKIYHLNPEADWTKQAILEAKAGPLLDKIQKAEENNDFDETEKLYEQLLLQSPDLVNNYIRYAKFFSQQKLYQKAIDITLQGIQEVPDSIPLYISLGYSYLMIDKLEDSRRVFKYVLEQDPLNTEALAGLGKVEAAIGDTEDATHLYKLALKIKPQDMTALSFLADLYMQEKNYSEAEKNLESILKIAPQARWAKQSLLKAKYGNYFEEIRALENSGDFHSAILKYQELLSIAPDSEEAYIGLGKIYNQLKQHGLAIEIYKKGLQADPSANQLRVDLGLTFLALNEFKMARDTLQMAHKLDPRNADAIAGLGKVALLEGDPERAYKMYTTALKLNPDNLLTLSLMAEFWMQEKQFDKALGLYDRILQIDPKAIWARTARTDAKYGPLLEEAAKQENNKDYADAEAIYLQLIKKLPNQVNYYIRLGQLYNKMKLYQKAISLYQNGLNILPKSDDLRIALGFAYLNKGDLEIGKNMFEIVLSNNPKNAEALAGLGRYNQLQGQTADAVKLYQKALKTDPNNITTLVFLSQMMFDLGHYEYSQKLYEKIFQLQPSQWAKIAIEDAKHGQLISEIKKKDKADDYEGAEILWKQLLMEEPNLADYYLRFGLFYHSHKQYDKAIDVYLKGINIDPNAELYAALGLVYISKKDFGDAEKAFNHSLKLDPKNPDALAGLGYVNFTFGHFQEAERLIKTALAIDPNSVMALSSLGDLWIKEKRYNEAQKVYEKLLALRPHDKWIRLSLDDARFGSELDKISALIQQEQYSEAARIYQFLLEKSPDNQRYYYGLGQMYMRLKDYSQSIAINLSGLEKNPEDNELRIALGYAYFFNKDLENARIVLNKALEVDDKNPEALAGLGQVNVLDEDYCTAEVLFNKALSKDPKNQSALSFLGNLLMRQRRYREAQEIFVRLAKINPGALWVQREWQNAADGPLMDIANSLADKEEFELAANIYRQLVEAAPDDPARYLQLGQMYINLQEYCCGIRIFRQGLMIDPEAWYLWRAIGFAYILLEDFNASQNIFSFLVVQDPDDAESWAGLGRIQALNGSICLAESYYASALQIDAKNITALSFLADLRQEEQYNFSALSLYEEINQIVVSNQMGRCEPKPKWLTRSYNNILNLTRPTIGIGGMYHEEDQWDPTLHRWSAEYLVYGGSTIFNYPINNCLDVWGKGQDQFYVLKDLINQTTIYSFDVQRFYVGAKWVYNPCWFIEATAGLTNYSQYRHSTFRLENGIIAEPTLSLIRHTPIEKLTLSVSSGSDLVARNFSRNVARLVGYYFLAGAYERKIIKRGWIGFEADAFWYDDFVHNNSQRVIAWFQWRPPCYSENILFRYYGKYQTFAKNIPDYYTYKPQFINQLQVTLEKRWRVCWADTFYTSLSYAYGWQDTHTRFPNVIVITPFPTNPPLVWDRRRFNLVFGSIIYKYDRLQFTLGGDFYRDTEKYTIWSVAGDLIWRF